MTLSVSLHKFTRAELSAYCSEEGDSSLKFFGNDWNGDETQALSVWLPREMAEEIYAVIKKHMGAKEQEAA